MTGDIRTTADNQVIDNIRLRGRIYVRHNGVVIKNSILEGDTHYAIYALAGTSRISVLDSDVHAGMALQSKALLRRLHIYALPNKRLADGLITSADGITIDRVRVERLWIPVGDQTHMDGLQFTGARDMVITNSYIDPTPQTKGGVTGSVFVHQRGAGYPRAVNFTMRCTTLVKAPMSYYPLRLTDIDGHIEVVNTTFVGVGENEAPVHVAKNNPTRVVWRGNKHSDGREVPEPAW